MRSSREKALPLLSNGVSSKAGPEWRIYSGSVLVIFVGSSFFRTLLYPLGLFLGTGCRVDFVATGVTREDLDGGLEEVLTGS